MSEFSGGTLATLGLVDELWCDAAKELLKQVRSDDLETVRFVFPDQHGVLHGKAIVAEAVPSILKNGITAPSSLLLKDTSGRTVFPVWETDAGFGSGVMTGAGDMLLVPDPSTYRRLPWSPHSAWVLCDVVQSDGSQIPFAPRSILKACEDKLGAKGLALVVGLELEFHIFKLVEQAQTHEDGGMPGTPPQTVPLNQGYQLLGEVAYSNSEPLLDELRRTARALGMPVRSVEVEFGPGQFEFTFEPASPLTHADNMVLFRTMTKEVCARMGLHATFMSKPDLPNCAASGWHIHQSLKDTKTGENMFEPEGNNLTRHAEGWIAGLLAHAAECCLLTTPTINGYGRYSSRQLAPDRIQWARDNKGAMLRALMRPGDNASRIENRISEPGANPYFVLASQILSGLSGINAEVLPPPPVEMPYDSSAERLPESLADAISRFEDGSLLEPELGGAFLHYMKTLKSAEWVRYQENPEGWEHREYFQLL